MTRPPDDVDALHQRSIDAGRVSYAVRDLTASVREHDRALAQRMRLKMQEYQAMEHILDAEGSLGPVELASRLGLAVPTTSELLDRLQESGHVLRQRDELDGRRIRLVPTPSAISAIIAEITPMIGTIEDLVAGYSDEEQAVIVRFLGDAAQAFRDGASSSDGREASAIPPE